MIPPRLLLCSASPRRRELLSQLGFSFESLAPKVDESRLAGEPIAEYPERVARLKAMAGLSAWGGRPVVALAADTIVVVGDEVLGKPRDRGDAERMLRRIEGREHRVLTGVCVAANPADATPQLRSRTVTTRVWFAPLSPSAVRWLVDSGDSDDKAGAYAVQGLAGAFVERLEGSFTNVVGLPLLETLELLAEVGVRPPWEPR